MPSREAARILRDPGYPSLKEWVIGRTGLGYWSDKDSALAERLARVLEDSGLATCTACLDALNAEAAEGPLQRRLLAEVTIAETYFFRFPEQFDALRQSVLPQCIERNRAQQRLSIWSAGCSNGAEPYSLAILLRRLPELTGWHIRILATDVSPAQLEAARAAEYNDWALRDLSPQTRRTFFDPHGTLWRLKPEFRRNVELRLHNLALDGPPPGAPFDLILCRNVLIYFTADIRARVVDLLARSLRDGGWLVFGHAEGGVELARTLVPVRYPEATLYRKLDQPQPPAVTAPQPPRPARPPPRRHSAPPASTPKAADPSVLETAERLADGGEWRKLLEQAADWMAQEPLEPLPHYYQALALAHLDGDAAAAYRRAVYLDRGFALAHFQLARLRLDQGATDEAARHFRNVVALTERAAENAPVLAGGSLTAGELKVIADRWLQKLSAS